MLLFSVRPFPSFAYFAKIRRNTLRSVIVSSRVIAQVKLRIIVIIARRTQEEQAEGIYEFALILFGIVTDTVPAPPQVIITQIPHHTFRSGIIAQLCIYLLLHNFVSVYPPIIST